jgi:Tfp pilus assembly protein PilO
MEKIQQMTTHLILIFIATVVVIGLGYWLLFGGED